MQITYKNNKMKKICNDATVASKEYGDKMAVKIHQRIDEISAALNVEMLLKFKIGRCHSLLNNRKGQYAMDLIHPYRLIFTVDKSGNLQIANIEERVDYH